jgi:hypothetical protein
LELKFSYLWGWGQTAAEATEPDADLHTLKLSVKSVRNPGEAEIVNALANTDVSNLAFVNQFFKFLPRKVGIRGQRLVNDDLPIDWFLLESNWPETRPSASKTVTGICSAHQ